MKVFCVFSLESPHRGDSNENIQYTIFNTKRKITLSYPKSAAMRFFLGTQARFRNSRGRRAISVRATEVLLYVVRKDQSGLLRSLLAKIRQHKDYSKMNEWMTCDFISFSSVFQSYQNNGRSIIKCCVQWNPVYD